MYGAVRDARRPSSRFYEKVTQADIGRWFNTADRVSSAQQRRRTAERESRKLRKQSDFSTAKTIEQALPATPTPRPQGAKVLVLHQKDLSRLVGCERVAIICGGSRTGGTAEKILDEKLVICEQDHHLAPGVKTDADDMQRYVGMFSKMRHHVLFDVAAVVVSSGRSRQALEEGLRTLSTFVTHRGDGVYLA